MIDVYIHIGVLNNVNEVLSNILNTIHNSGLYNNCESIYLCVNGDYNKLEYDDCDKYELIINDLNIEDSRMEFPTLDLIKKNSNIRNNKILYLMTKGVTKPSNINIKQQLDMLLYFNVDKWEDRLNELSSYDCTGVNLNGNKTDLDHDPLTWGYGKAPLHYSGNFWWTTPTHVNKLPKPSDWCISDDYVRYRMMCEMWICQIEAKYNSCHQSGVNHYTSPYPSYKYKQ